MDRECINCPKLGVSCDGKEQLTMPKAELLEWMRIRTLELLRLHNPELFRLLKDVDTETGGYLGQERSCEILIDDEKYSDHSASIE